MAADPDCGIEVFRGAEPDWVFALEKWFGPHQTVILPRSHRLGEPLASHAGALMAQSLGEAGDGSGPLPADHETAFECRLYASVAEEVDAVARELRRLHLMGQVPWQEMAVLVSQPSYLLGPLQRALRSYEVPYLPLSSERPLSSEPPVGWFLDLVRVAMAGEEWEGLLPNLLTSPLVGLDYAARRRLERLAWQERRSLAEMAEEAPEAAEFRALRDLVVEHRARADECFWQVYRASSYCQRLAAAAREASGPAATAELDALVALSHALGRFVERRHGRGSIVEYLEEASRADFGGDPWLAPAGLPRGAAGLDRVALVSFHAAKGREWEVVVVAGCLDTWIPKGRRARGLFDPLALEISEIADREVEAIADDRRTFYVAATRARRKAIFTVSSGPGGRGRPSRFLVELAGAPPESVSTADPSPVT
ncbi:MAG: 3'-5' exonuclease, partial [Acidimicrobiales bacterium]